MFYVDPSGHFWTELWEGTKEVAKNVGNFLLSAAKNTGKELSDNSTGFAVAGSMAAADGPAPFGDTAGLLTVIGIIAVSAVKGVYDTATTFEWTDYSSQTKSVPKEEAESKTQTKFATPKKKPNQSVYLLFDENTNQIEYVGRTYNLDVRAAQHSSRLSPRNHLTMIPIPENISYEAARGLEQKGIEKYHTLNNRFLPGGNAYNNQINGISIFNPNYSTYMTAAVPYEAKLDKIMYNNKYGVTLHGRP